MVKKAVLSVFAVFFLLKGGFAENLQISIAVNDLKAVGKVQADEKESIAALSDLLRDELQATGAFWVMGRTEMEKIIGKQGMLSGGAYLLQQGRRLGVSRMAGGTVERVGDKWKLSVKILDVATARVLETINEEFDGSIQSAAPLVTPKIAAKIAAGAGLETKGAAPAVKTGDLNIESSQPGAAVEIDGTPMNGVTPLALQGFTAGSHSIVVRKNVWTGSQTVTLNPGEQRRVFVAMEQGKGTIIMQSTPPGCSVTVDGREAGVTPLRLDSLPAGVHVFTFSKNGYIGASDSVTIGAGETKDTAVALREAASLLLAVQPSAAAVTIDGRPVQVRPMESFTVPSGTTIEIQASAADYDDFRQVVVLSGKEKKTLEIRLAPRFGTIRLESNPPGAEAFLGGKRVGTTPCGNEKVMPGVYPLRLSLAAYESVEENLSVLKGQACAKRYDLKHTRAFVDSVKKAAHRKSLRKRGIALGIAAAGTFGAGIFFNTRAQQQVDKLNKVRADYIAAVSDFDTYQAAYTKEKDKMDSSLLLRNILYAVSGSCVAVFAVSIPF